VILGTGVSNAIPPAILQIFPDNHGHFVIVEKTEFPK
jgi:hypothetical protein